MRFCFKSIFRTTMYKHLYLWSTWWWLIKPKHVVELTLQSTTDVLTGFNVCFLNFIPIFQTGPKTTDW